MDREHVERALTRLDAAVRRAETAARRAIAGLSQAPAVDPAEHTGLQERHTRLKQSVEHSLRQLDDILAGVSH